MTPKQKTAIAALLVSALVAASAVLAPGVRCAPPDPQLVEDALGVESESSAGSPPKPDLGDGSSSSSNGGSST